MVPFLADPYFKSLNVGLALDEVELNSSLILSIFILLVSLNAAAGFALNASGYRVGGR